MNPYGTTGVNSTSDTLNVSLDSISEIYNLIMNKQLPGIPIYKTDSWMSYFNTSETPQILKTKLLDKTFLYLMTNVGLICSEDIYDVIWDIGITLRWCSSWEDCQKFYDEHFPKEPK